MTNRTNEIESVAVELGYTESMGCSALDYIIENAKASVMVNQKNVELVAQVEDMKNLCLTTDEVNKIKADAIDAAVDFEDNRWFETCSDRIEMILDYAKKVRAGEV